MAITTANKDIKIPTQHYVGFNKRGDHEIPLGFMTPDGTDDSAKKRKATVDQWAKGQSWQNKIPLPAQVFENKPLSGFKFGNSVRHGGGWGQGTVKWRIEDPRGFELEISSPNLQQIMEISTIECGEILDKCIWGRLKNENILIPVTSEVYKTAQLNTERAGKSASLKDLNIGDHVVLQNGKEGRYFGAHYQVQASYEKKIKQDDKKKHVIVNQSNGAVEFIQVASLKVSSIEPGEALTIEQAEVELNRLNGLRKDYSRATAFSHKPIKDVQYELRSFDITKWRARSSHRDVVLVFNGGNHWGLYDINYGTQFTGSRLPTASAVTRQAFLDGKGIEYITMSRGGYYGSQNLTFEVDVKDPNLVCETMHGSFKTATGMEVLVDF